MQGARLKRPARAGFFYIATNILSKAIGFLATPLFTRLLTPEEYGLYPLYLGWLGILTVVLGVGISGGAIYRGLGKYEGREEELISGAVGILAVSHIIFFIIVLVLRGHIEALTGFSPLIFSLLVGEVFLNSAQLVIFALFRYKYSYIRVCLINLLYAILSPTLSLAVIYLTPYRAETRIISSFAVTASLMLPELLRTVSLKRLYKGSAWRYLIRLSLPLLPHALFMALIAQSDKLIIERVLGTAELARYSVAYSVGFMLTALTNALYSALQPWLMRKLNEHDTLGTSLFIKRLLFLTAMGLSLFLFFIPEIFALAAGREFRDAELAVYPLAIAGVLQFVANILSSSIIHSERTAVLSLFSLGSFLLNLVLNLIFVPRLGYFVSALTTALSYGTLIVFEYLFLKNKRNDQLLTRESFIPFFAVAIPIITALSAAPLLSRASLAAATALFALPSAVKTGKMVSEG